ncbi:MAG: MFS transporter [Fuerstiella sp.]
MLLDFLQIHHDERRPFSWSAAWFMTLLAAYYIVRPVREALGSIEGSRDLPWLFTAVFLTMLVAVPLYSSLVARFSRRRLVPIVYRFLALNLLAFSIAMHLLDPEVLKYVARVFFVWVGVYALFSTSLFWSVMADVFSRDRGKRLFGTISGFGTVGAIAASFFVGRTSELIGPENLLLVSAALLEGGLACFRRLDSAALDAPGAGAAEEPSSPNPFAGFIQVVRSPYLRSIMLYVLSTTACGTFLYLTQADMMRAAFPEKDVRTGVFAHIDLAVQIVTIVFQVLVASRVMKWSLTFTLCILPTVYGLGFAGLSAASALPVLIAAMVLSRSSTYGLTVPALGVLYTVVSRDEKYKAKSVIDTLVIRGSDAGWNWIITALRRAGLMAPMLAAVMLPVAAFGLALAVLLGRRNATARTTGEVRQ